MTRETAINLLDNLIGMVEDSQGNDYNTAFRMAIEALKQTDWIPCSERLPKEDEYVLATTVWGNITMAENLGNDEWFIHEGNSNAYTEDILAWSPLPEPWKGEK